MVGERNCAPAKLTHAATMMAGRTSGLLEATTWSAAPEGTMRSEDGKLTARDGAAVILIKAGHGGAADEQHADGAERPELCWR